MEERMWSKLYWLTASDLFRTMLRIHSDVSTKFGRSVELFMLVVMSCKALINNSV